MSFTLFVILPSGDVCSLRRLPSGSPVRAVRKALELSAGLPAHTYDLACLKDDGGGGRDGGGPLADDVPLELGRNVWDGFVLRACLRERFLDLYRAVLANDVRRVLEGTGGGAAGCVVNGEGAPGTREAVSIVNGEGVPGTREAVNIVNGEGAPGTREAVSIVNGKGAPGTREDVSIVNGEGVPGAREDANIVNGEGVPGIREGVSEGGAVALFVASFLGMADMCTALLSADVGVDPDSTTPFGRTALFAAMHGDHARVLEVLLRHSASLETRDADGASAVDVAHARQAKDSLRKMRQLRLWSRANSAASSSSSSSSSSLLLSRTSPRRWDHHPRRGSGKKTPQHVIRIPTTADACAAEELLEEEEEEAASSFFPQRRTGDRASSGSGRIPRGGDGRSASPPARTDPPPSNGEEEAVAAGNAQEGARATTNGQEEARAAINGQEKARAASNGQEEARAAINGQEEARAAGNAREGARATTNGEEEARATSNGPPPPPATAKTAPTRQSGRPSPGALFPRGEVRYTWDGNLRPLSRTSSRAGTPVRIPVPTGGGGRDRVPSGRSGVGAGGHWGDAVSEAGSRSGSRGRQRSVRVSVQEFSLPGPHAVLKLSVSPPRSNHPPDRKMWGAAEQGVWNHGQDYEERDLGSTQADEMGQDPPERPPSPADGVPGTSRREGRDTRALPAGSLHTAVPEPGKGAKGDRDTSADTREPAGPSPRAAAARAARDKGGSPRAGPNLGKSRRKKQQQQASWRTMKRRLKLAEEHKRHTAPTTTKAQHRQGDDKTGPHRASFEQWLERKNKERRRHEPDGSSSGAGSSSDGGCSEGDGEGRAADNAKAFSDWLRDLRERPLRAPHPFTPASLHRRKSRPLKNLIQVGVDGVEAVPPPDPDGYMRAYRDWRRAKGSTDSPDQPLSPRDLKEAWHRMEEKRKSLLSAALTYEDWLEHSEQRQKLMQAILRSRSSQSSDTDQDSLRRAPRQISFLEWRERVGKREAETRHDTHHRKQTEPHYDQNGVLVNDVTRSSAAIPHEEWLKRKRRERQKSAGDRKVATGDDGSRTTGLDVGRRGAGAGENNRSTATVSEEERKEESAWELWLQRKHQNEMERLSKGVY